MVPAIARRNETSTVQIGEDLGISDALIRWWLAKADVGDGLKPATTTIESAELREANKRTRLLERWKMRSCVERRCIWDGASTQNEVPSRARSRVREDPCFAVLPCVG